MKIQVYTKNVYGNELIYPANEAAKVLAALVGKKTLDRSDFVLAAKLGHEVELVANPESAKAIGFVTQVRGAL